MYIQVGKLLEKTSKRAINKAELKLPLIRIKVIAYFTLTF